MKRRSRGPRGWTFAALTAIATCGVPARAGDAPTASPAPEETVALANAVKAKLHVGRHAEAVEFLDAEACAALAATPPVAHEVASAIAREQANALRKDPSIAALLVEKLGALACPDDRSPEAEGIRALRELLWVLTGRLHERPAPLADVRKALAARRKLDPRLPPAQPTYVALAKLAHLVATRAPSDADAWGAVLVVAEPLRTMDPPDEALTRAFADAALERGLLLAPADAAAARPVLEQGLATYERRQWARPAKDGSWPDGTALFHRALTAAKRLGGAAKVEYAYQLFKSRGEKLVAKVPVLRGWDWSYTKDDQDYGKLVRDRPGIDKIEIQLWGYNGWPEYSFSDGSVVPGENLDGFLKRGMKADRASLVSVTREARTNDAVNAVLKGTKGYEIKGISVDGVPTRYRNWFCKDPFELKRFFNVAVTQTGTYDEKDPELLFVLDSIGDRWTR